MNNWLRKLCLAAGVMAIVLASTSTNPTATSRTARKYPRLDLSLQAAAAAHSRDPQRVIISVRPGSRSAVRRALAAHGDRILAEHDSIDAITAVVRGQELETLASHDAVVSVSRDAVVSAHGGQVEAATAGEGKGATFTVHLHRSQAPTRQVPRTV